MNAICINNEGFEGDLTLGDVYEVSKQGNYAILDSDDGLTKLTVFFNDHFEVI